MLLGKATSNCKFHEQCYSFFVFLQLCDFYFLPPMSPVTGIRLEENQHTVSSVSSVLCLLWFSLMLGVIH